MKDNAMTLFVGCMLGLAVGLMAGINGGSATERERAVKAGVGGWRIDPATGEKVFAYGKEKP